MTGGWDGGRMGEERKGDDGRRAHASVAALGWWTTRTTTSCGSAAAVQGQGRVTGGRWGGRCVIDRVVHTDAVGGPGVSELIPEAINRGSDGAERRAERCLPHCTRTPPWRLTGGGRRLPPISPRGGGCAVSLVIAHLARPCCSLSPSSLSLSLGASRPSSAARAEQLWGSAAHHRSLPVTVSVSLSPVARDVHRWRGLCLRARAALSRVAGLAGEAPLSTASITDGPTAADWPLSASPSLCSNLTAIAFTSTLPSVVTTAIPCPLPPSTCW